VSGKALAAGLFPMLKIVTSRHHEDFERQINDALSAGWLVHGWCHVFQCEDQLFFYVGFLTRTAAAAARTDAPLARDQPLTDQARA
jgi:hypothetical protein